jgi:predicted metal-dependent hydrolase
MLHLLERGHGKRFIKLMNDFMPDWQARRDRLRRSTCQRELG